MKGFLHDYDRELGFEAARRFKVARVVWECFTIVKSSAPRIRYPLLDPFFKLLVKCTGMKNLLEWKPIEFLRLSTQIPIPGYFAAEILAKKTP